MTKEVIILTISLVTLGTTSGPTMAVDKSFQFPVFDYAERSVWTPMRVLGSLMAKQNGHYQKCIRDTSCDMLKYHEWYTYISSNGLQLRYNKDTFKLKQWRLNK